MPIDLVQRIDQLRTERQSERELYQASCKKCEQALRDLADTIDKISEQVPELRGLPSYIKMPEFLPEGANTAHIDWFNRAGESDDFKMPTLVTPIGSRLSYDPIADTWVYVPVALGGDGGTPKKRAATLERFKDDAANFIVYHLPNLREKARRSAEQRPMAQATTIRSVAKTNRDRDDAMLLISILLAAPLVVILGVWMLLQRT